MSSCELAVAVAHLGGGVAGQLGKVALGSQALDDLLWHIGSLIALQGGVVVACLPQEVAQLLAGSQLILQSPAASKLHKPLEAGGRHGQLLAAVTASSCHGSSCGACCCCCRTAHALTL